MVAQTTSATTEILLLADIRADVGTQTRVGLNEPTVAEYLEIIREHGIGKFPPIGVVYDGNNYWLCDGFHRLAAMKRSGVKSCQAEITEGTQRDAILLACGANAEHGLRRSDEDKRRAIALLLADEEWAAKSDRWIADQCKVSPTLVGRVRASVVHVDTCETRTGRDGKNYSAKPKPTVQLREVSSTEYASAAAARAREDVAVASPQQQVADFFNETKTAGKQHEASSDTAEIESPAVTTKAEDKGLGEVDSTGRPVPSHLLESMSLSAQISNVRSLLTTVKKEVNKLSKLPGGEHLPQPLLIDEFDAMLKHSRYQMTCPMCEGKGRDCHTCRGHGWLSYHTRLSTMPDEFKRRILEQGGTIE